MWLLNGSRWRGDQRPRFLADLTGGASARPAVVLCLTGFSVALFTAVSPKSSGWTTWPSFRPK